MCQPGKPSPQGLSHFTSRPGSAAFHKVKSRGVPLQRVRFRPHALQQVAANVPGELAVVRKARHIEVNIPARFVGVATLQQLPRHGHHFRYVLRGPGEDVGGQYIDLRLVLVEAVGIKLRDLLGCPSFGKGGQNHLVPAGLHQLLPHVAHVGNILDVVDLQPLDLQNPPYPVGHKVGPQIPDVGVTVHSWPASVHAHLSRLNRLDFLHLLGQRVVYAQQAAPLYWQTTRKLSHAALSSTLPIIPASGSSTKRAAYRGG